MLDAAGILALLPPVPGRLAVVLCDGEAPSPGLLAACLARADLFLCADRAGWPHAELPRRPDLVVGDFDTLGAPPPDSDIPYEHDPDQDTTDAEKAVLRAAAAGCGRVLLLGADGGHRDHDLANLALPERFAAGPDVVLVGDRGVSLRPAPGADLVLDLPAGTVVSLNPCGRVKGVALAGVRWPLHGADLDWGGPTAVSNRVDAPPLRLRCASGPLLLTIRAGMPPGGAP